MTRKEYILLRAGGNLLNIVHKFYAEKFDQSKHSRFIHIQEMAAIFPMLGEYGKHMIDTAIEYYDNLFSITTLTDKNGKFIKFL